MTKNVKIRRGRATSKPSRMRVLGILLKSMRETSDGEISTILTQKRNKKTVPSRSIIFLK